jgi:soluble lytic murein transglycosylase-like protein
VAPLNGRTFAAPASTAPRLPNNLGPLVAEAGRRYGVDPSLIAGVMEAESGFNPDAVSPAGARGLMQLMDGTARSLGVDDPLDPTQSVLGGAKLLGQLLQRYGGDASLALAAYNAGSGAVDRYGGVPPYAETQRYVPRVLQAAARYRLEAGRASWGGLDPSERER